VTARQLSPTAQLSACLSRFPPEVVALAKRSLPKLRRWFPGCCQLVYNYPRSVVVAFAASERGYEALVAVGISPGWVRLYFDKSLPDPGGLLEGSGTRGSLVLKAASDLDRGDIQALIKAAIRHCGATLPRSGSIRVVMKPGSKKRTARKARRA